MNPGEILQSDKFKSTAKEIAAVGRFFAEQRWSPATSSNYSVKLDSQYIALTRSGVDKYAIEAADVIVVNRAGEVVAPLGEKPSAETLIHCRLYDDERVGAVLHTHSIFGTRLSLAHEKDRELQITGYELLKGLQGNRSHLVKETIPVLSNSQDMKEFVSWMEDLDFNTIHGFLIAGHGLYTWGRDLKEARRHVETYEFLFESMAYERLGF